MCDTEGHTWRTDGVFPEKGSLCECGEKSWTVSGGEKFHCKQCDAEVPLDQVESHLSREAPH
jgi:hypothetical protein